jgi:Zn-dependent protease with chaperone function
MLWTIAYMINQRYYFLLIVLVGMVLGATVLQVLSAFRFLLHRPDDNNELELPLTRKRAPGLFDLVDNIAAERALRAPDEIRVAADSLAHVYEGNGGKKVLVVGAIPIASFSQEALAGVLAHELGHFTAGDTRLSRHGFKPGVVMACLDWQFSGHAASNLNPAVWLIRAYHLLFNFVWAVHSRECEYAADRHEVALVGKKTAAAALIHVIVTEQLPWCRLSNVAKSYAATNQRIEKIFTEQAARAKSTEDWEWEDALRKALKAKQGLFDSHPALRDRLKAMGISAKKALALATDMSGPPATELFADWASIEKELTVCLMHVVTAIQAAKMEMAQIFRAS